MIYILDYYIFQKMSTCLYLSYSNFLFGIMHIICVAFIPVNIRSHIWPELKRGGLNMQEHNNSYSGKSSSPPELKHHQGIDWLLVRITVMAVSPLGECADSEKANV